MSPHPFPVKSSIEGIYPWTSNEWGMGSTTLLPALLCPEVGGEVGAVEFALGEGEEEGPVRGGGVAFGVLAEG